jgi:hypothetical protein
MIREYEKRDEAALKAIHEASGFDYQFPNLDDPLCVVKRVIAEEGRVVQGIVVKLEGEVYIWVAPDWGTPELRWLWLQELTEEAKKAAWEKGLDSLVCVVPPEIADSFEKRLKQIGMVKNLGWPRFSFDLTAYTPKEVRVESENRTLENNSEPVLRD